MSGKRRYTEVEAARMLASGEDSPLARQFEADRREWARKQVQGCPPLSERQKAVIRTAFAAHRAEQAGAA